ncbi:PORR domain-containing protein [Psidium guajava]|nr:PORR domain-containing protein [Psidium guajava]
MRAVPSEVRRSHVSSGSVGGGEKSGKERMGWAVGLPRWAIFATEARPELRSAKPVEAKVVDNGGKKIELAGETQDVKIVG